MKSDQKFKIFDPVRGRYVALTPEEEVRQFFIHILRQQCQVPVGYISVERKVEVGQRKLRADLRVYNRRMESCMVIECKRREVVLDEAVCDQVLRYSLEREERFVVITNAVDCRVWEKNEKGVYCPRKTLPSWTEINVGIQG